MKTRIQMLVLSVIALVTMLGITPQTCNAGPITTVYTETIDNFTLKITGAGFNANDGHSLTLSSGSWLVTLTLTEQAGVAGTPNTADILTITGMAQHIVGPHGEGPNANGFAINFLVNASTLPLGMKVLPLSVGTINHGQHQDIFTGMLVFTTAIGAGTFDITQYELSVNGVHTPEPATLLLLGTGLAGIAAAARRRRRMHKKQDG